MPKLEEKKLSFLFKDVNRLFLDDIFSLLALTCADGLYDRPA